MYIFSGFSAGLFQAISGEDAQWWSLLFIQEDIPSLANLLGKKQDNFQSLLCYASLGSIRKKDGKFLFQKSNFESFIQSNELNDAVELNFRKPPGFNNPQCFIRIGKLNKSSIRVAGSSGLNSRVRCLAQPLQVFNTTIYNCLSKLEKGKATNTNYKKHHEILHSNQQITKNIGEDINTVIETAVGETEVLEELVIIRIKTKLLPLLFKDEILRETSLWKEHIDVSILESVIDTINIEIKQKREEAVSNILQSQRVDFSPTAKAEKQFCSTLQYYVVPIHDNRITNNLLKDIFYLNKKIQV